MARKRRMEEAQDWLYLVAVGALALYLVIGVIAWAWMIIAGIPVPDAFGTILAAIAGALAGMLAPLQNPATRPRDDRAPGPPPVEPPPVGEPR